MTIRRRRQHTTRLSLRTRTRLRAVFKWSAYALVMLVCFLAETTPWFLPFRWKPLLLLPLILSVAMFEKELPAAVFGMTAGLFADMAMNTLDGFHGALFLFFGVAAALFVRHLVRARLVNLLLLTIAAALLEGLLVYFFRYRLWDIPQAELLLSTQTFPAMISTVAFAAPVYGVIRLIAAFFHREEDKGIEPVREELEMERTK